MRTKKTPNIHRKPPSNPTPPGKLITNIRPNWQLFWAWPRCATDFKHSEACVSLVFEVFSSFFLHALCEIFHPFFER